MARRLALRRTLLSAFVVLLVLAGGLWGVWGVGLPGPVSAPAPASGSTSIPPTPTRWVTDGAGFLEPATRDALDAQLEDYQRRTGHQVVVWIGPSPAGDSVEDFAVRAFEAWGIGRKGQDDGLAIFVFADARKIRFEVGYGLEDRVPDAIASRIIAETMAPRLQAGDRNGAVTAGVAAALAAITPGIPGIPGESAHGLPGPGEAGNAPQKRPLSLLEIIVFSLVGLVFLVILVTHPSLAIWLLINIFTGGRGGGGGFGGGGGGGGFSGGGGGGGFSGGGGRSGGGGATGSW
jgi:uncharacterized protein